MLDCRRFSCGEEIPKLAGGVGGEAPTPDGSSSDEGSYSSSSEGSNDDMLATDGSNDGIEATIDAGRCAMVMPEEDEKVGVWLRGYAALKLSTTISNSKLVYSTILCPHPQNLHI